MLQASAYLDFNAPTIMLLRSAEATEFKYHMVAAISSRLGGLDIVAFVVQAMRRALSLNINEGIDVADGWENRPTATKVLDLIQFFRDQTQLF
jgi:hypothetical protein